jgi:molybdopterin converting factor small subunit
MNEPVVHVELFGVARLAANERAARLPYDDARSVAAVVAALGRRFPQLIGPVISADGRTLLGGYILNLNGRDFVADPAMPLQPGDTVLLLAAAAGG